METRDISGLKTELGKSRHRVNTENCAVLGTASIAPKKGIVIVMKNRMLRTTSLILVAAVVVGLAYVRLAPSDAAKWHNPVVTEVNTDFAGGVIRLLGIGPDGLVRIDAVVRTLPRTVVLTGSVEEGRITYVTRSKIIGFPDYTTIEQHGDTVRMFARLRFGNRDFGVNLARLEQLVQAIE